MDAKKHVLEHYHSANSIEDILAWDDADSINDARLVMIEEAKTPSAPQKATSRKKTDEAAAQKAMF